MVAVQNGNYCIYANLTTQDRYHNPQSCQTAPVGTVRNTEHWKSYDRRI